MVSHRRGVLLFVLVFLGFLLHGPATALAVGLIQGDVAGSVADLFQADYLVAWPFNGLPLFWDAFLGRMLIPLALVLGGLAGGILLTPLYLAVHRLFHWGKRIYRFVGEPRPRGLGGMLKRAALPTFLAIHITLVLTPLFIPVVLAPQIVASESLMTQLLSGSLYTVLLALPLSFALVTPTWILDDAGLIALNREAAGAGGKGGGGESGGGAESSAGMEELPNVMGVGSWYARMMKGYAGIAVIITYVQVVLSLLLQSWMRVVAMGVGELPYFLADMITLPVLPLILMVISLPLLMLLTSLSDRSRGYVRILARKVGITEGE